MYVCMYVYDKERMKSQTCWTNGPRPNLFFFLFPLTPPRGTRRTLPTQRLIGPRPTSPFSLYTTSWRRAEVPDTLLKRSPTDLCFLFLSFSYTTSWHIFLFFFGLHHLVAQTRSFRGIAKTVHNDYEAR